MENREHFIEQVIAARDRGAAVQVLLGNSPLPYFTLFDSEQTRWDNLRHGKPISIKALDPPVGNVRIRNIQEPAQLSFYTDREIIQFKSDFIDIIDRETIIITYPETFISKPQQRDAVRVVIDTSLDMSVEIIYGPKKSIRAQLKDISSGGLVLFLPEKAPLLDQGNTIKLTIHAPQRPKIEVKGTIIRHFQETIPPDPLQNFYCVRFSIEDYGTAQEIDALVAKVQRIALQRRRDLFHHEL
ncbi:PilZ domain-containing protein [Magnetococcales bacterium HHB-1]